MRKLAVLLLLALVACSDAQASRARRSDGSGRARGTAGGVQTVESLNDSFEGSWKYIFSGDTYDGDVWTDSVTGRQTDRIGTITADQSTADIDDVTKLGDALENQALVFGTSSSRFDSTSAGGAASSQNLAFADNTGGIHFRVVGKKTNLSANTMYYIHQPGGAPGSIQLYETTSSASITLIVNDGSTSFTCSMGNIGPDEITLETWYILDVVLVDTEDTSPYCIGCINGICETDLTTGSVADPGAYDVTATLRIGSYVGSRATGEYLLWFGMRENTPAFQGIDNYEACINYGFPDCTAP